MESFSIERVGIPNLDFTGELIGQSGGPAPRVKIYRTQALKFIGQLNANQKISEAQHLDKAPDLINWFKNPYTIPPEAQEAIEDATNHDEVFKAAWNEHVD